MAMLFSSFGLVLSFTSVSTLSDSIWGEWGECSRTCGDGIRMRACREPDSTDDRCHEFNPKEMIETCDAGPCRKFLTLIFRYLMRELHPKLEVYLGRKNKTKQKTKRE